MRTRVLLALIPFLVCGCSGVDQPADRTITPEPSPSEPASIGASVSSDDPALSRTDSAGNTPEEVLLAYIRANNRSDWKTVYSLSASPSGDYETFAARRRADEAPWDDFKMYETRIVEPNRALVRVTYSTIGFSALEGQTPEQARRVVVVRQPGEWWVLEKSGLDDAVWRVTAKGPND